MNSAAFCPMRKNRTTHAREKKYGGTPLPYQKKTLYIRIKL